MGHGHRRHVERLSAERPEAFESGDERFDAVADLRGTIDVDAAIAAFADTPTFEERQAQLRARYEFRRNLVNAGAHDELVYGITPASAEDVRFIVDGNFDPNANRVDARTLQRDVRIQGSGHGGGGRRRAKTVVIDVQRAQQQLADAAEAIHCVHLPTRCSSGSTCIRAGLSSRSTTGGRVRADFRPSVETPWIYTQRKS